MSTLVTRRPRTELAAIGLAAALLACYVPVLRALLALWAEVPYYSYGFLVPIFSAYLAWDARTDVGRQPLAPAPRGLMLVAVGVAVLAAGYRAGSVTLQTVSLPVALAGLLIATLGIPRTRTLAFPLVFLVFMTPLPDGVLPALSMPLQQVAAATSEWLLWLVGVPVAREGLFLTLPSVRLEVTEACNGLRFLLAMIVVGGAFAGMTQTGWRRRALVMVAAVVAALVANCLRVAGTGMLAELYGHEVAGGFYHIVWGKIIYAAMLLPFGLFVVALRRRV
jgi:exosortase